MVSLLVLAPGPSFFATAFALRRQQSTNLNDGNVTTIRPYKVGGDMSQVHCGSGSRGVVDYGLRR